MYQLFLSWRYCMNPPATAPAGGTAMVTTRRQRSGSWFAAT